jgi:hypothetical protein
MADEDKNKTFWEKYGIYLTIAGFGLSFILLLIIVYLVWTRHPSPEMATPMQMSSYPQSSTQFPMSEQVSADRTAASTSPLRSRGSKSSGQFDGGRRGGRGGEMSGGCGCAGIAVEPKY